MKNLFLIDNKMPNCPTCKENVNLLIKEWNYSVYNVKNFRCDKCLKSFNVYYKQNKFSHIINVNVDKELKPKTKVLRYLTKHYSASVDEISNDTGLDAKLVLGILNNLQKKGAVEPRT